MDISYCLRYIHAHVHVHVRTAKCIFAVESDVELLTSAYHQTAVIVAVCVVAGAVGREVQLNGFNVH